MTIFLGTTSNDTWFRENTTNDPDYNGGDDTYRFEAGAIGGSDWIGDFGGDDTVYIDASIEDVRFNTYNDLVRIGIVNASDGLRSTILLGDRAYRASTIERIEFSDGTVIDPRGGLTVGAWSSLDAIDGTDFADTVVSSGRDEKLRGGEGNDTYLWGYDRGIDRIDDDGGNDRIVLDADVDPADLRITTGYRVGDHLYLMLVDDNDNELSRVEITNGFSTSGRVEVLELADGSEIDLGGPLTISTSAEWDFVRGTQAGDTLLSSDRNEDLLGRAGNDTYKFDADSGNDEVRDESGRDTIEIAGVAQDDLRFTMQGQTLRIGTLDAQGYVHSEISIAGQANSGTAIETLALDGGTRLDLRGGLTISTAAGETRAEGTGADDTLISSSRNESLVGGDGDDIYRFTRGFGTDSIDETSGNDTVVLSNLGAVLVSIERSARFGYPGDDLVISLKDGRGEVLDSLTVEDHFRSPAGRVETVDVVGKGQYAVANLAQAIEVNLGAAPPAPTPPNPGAPAPAPTPTPPPSEDDVLMGNGRANRLKDLAGDNVFFGKGGNDRLIAGRGDDELVGGRGNDVLRAGGGDDVLKGGGGRDKLMGGGGNDVLKGGGGKDALIGGGGRDILKGGGGNDTLKGGGGRDKLIGGGGADDLMGGRGADTLRGGGGRDEFVFGRRDGTDRIVDFQDGRDKIAFTDGARVSNMSDLRMRERGDDVVVKAGATKIVVEDVDLADLTRGDFVFGWG